PQRRRHAGARTEGRRCRRQNQRDAGTYRSGTWIYRFHPELTCAQISLHRLMISGTGEMPLLLLHIAVTVEQLEAMARLHHSQAVLPPNCSGGKLQQASGYCSGDRTALSGLLHFLDAFCRVFWLCRSMLAAALSLQSVLLPRRTQS